MEQHSMERLGVIALVRSFLGRHSVGLVALFVALGGTSYAAVRAAGGRGVVKNAQLLSAQVRLAAGQSAGVISVARFAKITAACPADSNATSSLVFRNTSGRKLTLTAQWLDGGDASDGVVRTTVPAGQGADPGEDEMKRVGPFSYTYLASTSLGELVTFTIMEGDRSTSSSPCVLQAQALFGR
jgi:hypothetical protein